MIVLYIIASYLVMLGVFIETYDRLDNVKASSIAAYMCSPIVLPILIGMMLGKK